MEVLPDLIYVHAFLGLYFLFTVCTFFSSELARFFSQDQEKEKEPVGAPQWNRCGKRMFTDYQQRKKMGVIHIAFYWVWHSHVVKY